MACGRAPGEPGAVGGRVLVSGRRTQRPVALEVRSCPAPAPWLSSSRRPRSPWPAVRSDAPTTSGTGPAPPAPGTVLGLNSTKQLGTVVVDGNVNTLYRFDQDSANPPTTTCLDDCAEDWPPVLTDPAAKPVLEGIDESAVGTVTRPDGSNQADDRRLAGLPARGRQRARFHRRQRGGRRPGSRSSRTAPRPPRPSRPVAPVLEVLAGPARLQRGDGAGPLGRFRRTAALRSQAANSGAGVGRRCR